MIVANEKPIEEIRNMIAGYKRIFLVGCSSCVSVCFTGGRREVAHLAETMRVLGQKEGLSLEVEEESVLRQCEWEFVEPLKERVEKSEVTLSMACGVGIQTLAERYPKALVYPAVDTTFMGMPRKIGFFEENCAGCGQCILGETGGLCPVARCAKSLLNGPCGGAKDGRCEVSKDVPCVWEQIYNQLSLKNQLEQMEAITEAKNWSVGMAGSPRRRIRADLLENEGEK